MSPVARLISLSILTTLIVALGITFYHVIAPFLLPLFLAWVTAILCRPLYLWFVSKSNGRPRVAAGLTTVLLLLVVLLPLVLGTVFAAAQLVGLGRDLLQREDEFRQRLDELAGHPRVIALAKWLEPYLAEPDTTAAVTVDPGYAAGPDPFAGDNESGELDDEATKARLQARLQASVQATLKYIGTRTIGVVSEVPGVALGLLGSVVSLLVGLVMFAIGLYYFLCDGPELLEAAEGLIPVQKDYQVELLERFNQVVRAVVLSTFLSALAQGLLTTLALGLAGFERLPIFFVAASLMAMIPLAGTWLVWAPCAVWLAWHEQSYGWAIFLVIWGIAVVGTIDNLIRTFVLNTNAKLHPLLAFVSVLGGLQVMGLWGVFIAPVVAACLHALIQIFNTELRAFAQDRTNVREPSDTAVSPPVRPQSSEPSRSSPPPNDGPKRESKSVAKPVAAGAKSGKRRRR